MSIQSVLLPVLVEVGLIFLLLGWMAMTRRDALAGSLDARDIALSPDAFPSRSRQIANCYANQFEMPLLFMLAVIFGIVLRQTGWLFVILEWLFVAFRIGHAGIHTTSNVVSLRGPLFLGSAVCTLCLWGLIFVGMFLGPMPY